MEKITSEKELTVLTIDKGISLLGNALKSKKNAIAFRNTMIQVFNSSIIPRADLFEKFYLTFKIIYGDYLDDDIFDEEDYLWGPEIDNKIFEVIGKYGSKEKVKIYKDFQQKLYELFRDLDLHMEYNDLYELLLFECHNDFFAINALSIYEEFPERFIDS